MIDLVRRKKHYNIVILILKKILVYTEEIKDLYNNKI